MHRHHEQFCLNPGAQTGNAAAWVRLHAVPQNGVPALRLPVLSVAALAILAACAQPAPPTGTYRPGAVVYRLSAGDQARVQFRMLDAVNTVRRANGLAPLTLNPQLNAAALTHSRDMSRQARPWHFGSDGSSPLDRVTRVGYRGALVGETISETYETETETLTAWMAQRDTRAVILSPEATEMGFAFHQDPNGKIWWTLVLGAAAAPAGI